VAHLGIGEHRRGRPRWRAGAETGEYVLPADRWHTCFFDLSGDQGLLGQVEGRTADDAAYWLAAASPAWRDAVRVVAIDMCSIYAPAVRRALPRAQLVVDLFHVVQLAVKMTGDVRRRAVREKYGRRGRSGDAEYGVKGDCACAPAASPLVNEAFGDTTTASLDRPTVGYVISRPTVGLCLYRHKKGNVMAQPLIEKTVMTASGPAGYLDTGDGPGPAALFVHGVGTAGSLWRNVIDHLGGEYRCVAVDLPLHGRTPPAADYALGTTADFVAGFCDALGLTHLDLVANDTGGAIAQIFAARHPDLLHSFTLTNCETHDNVPPKAFLPTVLLARAGLFALPYRRITRDVRRARRFVFGAGYQDIEQLPAEVVHGWLEPLAATPERAQEFQRWIAALRPRDLLAAEPDLAKLQVPTLIVWGTGDRFFNVKWAYWLRDLIPGAKQVVEVPEARLFFPAERPADLAVPLLEFWKSI
jgi:pimeloyl-ACP methyl ester carboxylesterase